MGQQAVERSFLWMNELREYLGYTTKAGKFLPASEKKIREMFRDGLKKFYVGNRIAVYRADLDEYIEKKRGESKKGFGG